MKLHELLEDAWDDLNDSDDRDTIPNPLPLADYNEMNRVLDMSDDLESRLVDKYRSGKYAATPYPELAERARKQLGKIKSVPISAILSTEKYLDRKHISALVHNNSPRQPSGGITLIKAGNKYYVQDGNHRIAAAAERGENNIEALVIDVGNN